MFGGATSAAPSFSFGAPTQSAGGGFQLGTQSTSQPMFGSNVQPVASLSNTLSMFQNPQQQQQPASSLTAPSVFQPLPSLQPNVGLGGITTSQISLPFTTTSTSQTAALGGGGGDAGIDTIMTPKLTPIPTELMTVVENFKNVLKSQHDFAEQITTDDCFKDIKIIGQNIVQLAVDSEKTKVVLEKLSSDSKSLKDESRQSLRNGEMAHRIKESPAYSYEYTVLLNYLQLVAVSYERQLIVFAEQIAYLEGLISGKYSNSMSLNDILTHLKRIDELFKYIAVKIFKVHEDIKDLKETFLHYRRTVFGDKTIYFTDDNNSSPNRSNLPPTNRLEGPSPFTEASTGALLAMASALTRTSTSGGFGPSHFALSSNLGSSATFQPFTNVMAQKPDVPLFRSFATPTTTSAVAPMLSSLTYSTASSGFGSSTLSSSTTTTSAPSWNRFSSPFNTASSGVLFGGSATQTQNVGVARPIGVAVPAQQQTDVALKQPLGVKRGKT